MSIKLNGGSNPTSVKYNGSPVYEVKYKTSSSATAVTVWKQAYSVTIEDIFDTSTGGFLDEDGNYYPGGKVTNYVASWNSGDSKQIKVGSGEGTHTAYWSDSITVTWPAMYIHTVMNPVLFREACETTVSVTSNVTITPEGGSVIEPELPTSGWITDSRIVDYKTYTITARIECPVLPPATTTTTYNIAGKTGSVTGDVTSGQAVTNTISPVSLTTKNFTCTMTNNNKTVTETISNPFYHSSGKPDKPTITLISATGTQIKYTIYNPNNHPIKLEYGAEEAWGVDEVTVSAKGSKTYTQAVSGNWKEIELCADACAGNNKWSGYTYLTVKNPNYVEPIKAPTLSGSIQNGVLNDNGTDYVNYISLTIHNPNNYQVTATMELWTSTEGNDTYTQTIAANSSWHFYEEYSNQNAEADVTVYFTANGQQSSADIYLEGSTG